MIEVQDALALLLPVIAPLPSIEMPLKDALGRTLDEPVLADRDVPPADRSAMDGFAVRAGDCVTPGRVLAMIGEVRAGQDPAGIAVGPGQAVRLFTGAIVPHGADAVVMQEHAEEDRAAGNVVVREAAVPGQHIRPRGEDASRGASVCDRGALVRAAEIAVLAAVGRHHVRVIRPPRVAVLATGDEIVGASAVPAPHQVRNSNGAMLLALAQGSGAATQDLGIAEDEPGALDAAIAAGLAHDVLLVTGGVSVGAYDLVGEALSRAGCDVIFHNVAMRPGKPVLAARHGARLVFGLPGNPVSAFTGFKVFVAPALRKLSAHLGPVNDLRRAVLQSTVTAKPRRVTYQLARLTHDGGTPAVVPVASASSGDVMALARANAFIVLPAGSQSLSAGAEVDVLPW